MPTVVDRSLVATDFDIGKDSGGIEDGLLCFFRTDLVPSEVIAIGVIPIEFWLGAAHSLTWFGGRSQAAAPTVPLTPSSTLKHALQDNSNEKSFPCSLLPGVKKEDARHMDAQALAKPAGFEQHKLALPW